MVQNVDREFRDEFSAWCRRWVHAFKLVPACTPLEDQLSTNGVYIVPRLALESGCSFGGGILKNLLTGCHLPRATYRHWLWR